MSILKAIKNEDKFQVAVDYLGEYAGIRGVVIADNEGLVISRSGGADFNSDLFAAVALSIINSLDNQLGRLINPGAEYLTIKTHQDWMTVAQASSLLLVVVADRQVDDLLNIRITRALEMITAHLKNKYPALFPGNKPGSKRSSKNAEEIHV